MLNTGRKDRVCGEHPLPVPPSWAQWPHQAPAPAGCGRGSGQPAQVRPGPPAPGAQEFCSPCVSARDCPAGSESHPRDLSSSSCRLSLADPCPVSPSEWWGCVNKPVFRGLYLVTRGGTHCDILRSRA